MMTDQLSAVICRPLQCVSICRCCREITSSMQCVYKANPLCVQITCSNMQWSPNLTAAGGYNYCVGSPSFAFELSTDLLNIDTDPRKTLACVNNWYSVHTARAWWTYDLPITKTHEDLMKDKSSTFSRLCCAVDRFRFYLLILSACLPLLPLSRQPLPWLIKSTTSTSFLAENQTMTLFSWEKPISFNRD